MLFVLNRDSTAKIVHTTIVCTMDFTSFNGLSDPDEYVSNLTDYFDFELKMGEDLDLDEIRFPQKGVIKNPLNGTEKNLSEEDLKPTFCRDLLEKAIQIYDETNETYDKTDNTEFLMRELAKPSKNGCKFCPIRPACKSYLKKLEIWMGDITEDLEEIDIQDVVGSFVDKYRSGPRSSKGSIVIKDKDGRKWRIAGIDLDASRNKELKRVEKGDMIGVFNIYKNTRCELPEFINLIANKMMHVIYRIDY